MIRSALALALALALAPAVAEAQTCDAPVVSGEVTLRAQAFDQALPGGPAVPMWGFALDLDGDPGTPDDVCPPSVPGPRIVVPAGQPTLSIRLFNDLTVPVSLVVPGQLAPPEPTWVDDDGAVYTGSRPKRNVTARVRSFAAETPPGGDRVYAWTDLRPGTFLYQSGTHPAVQVQMGLFGAAVVAAAPGEAHPGVPYDAEAVLVLSEIDPAFHHAVAEGRYGPGRDVTSPMGYAPRWFLVNGEPFDPQSAPLAVATEGQTVLLRLLNAGLLHHAPTVDGWRFEVVARDGSVLSYPERLHAVDLPAGTTADVLTQPSAGGFELYDRRLFLGSTRGAGGMAVALEVAEVVPLEAAP